MNKYRILLVGEKDEVPHVSIRIDEKGEILFSPLIREGWSFAASMYMKSVINRTQVERCLARKFKSSIAAYGFVSQDAMMHETLKLARKLDKQKIHLGVQFMKVKISTGKTDPLIDLRDLKKKLKISITWGATPITILGSNGAKFVKIVKGE